MSHSGGIINDGTGMTWLELIPDGFSIEGAGVDEYKLFYVAQI